MRITLEPRHILFADFKVAVPRFASGEQRQGIPSNNGPRSLAIEIPGARGECAGYLLFMPVTWHWRPFKVPPKHLPDLDAFIDIKTITNRHHRLIVQFNAADHFAFVLVDGSRHPTYEFLGWTWGKDCKRDEFIDDPVGERGAEKRPAYFVPQRVLRPIEELFPILRAGQRQRVTGQRQRVA